MSQRRGLQGLKDACDDLFDRQFSFQEETSKGIGTIRTMG
jgi:plasmid replication initiation protein